MGDYLRQQIIVRLTLSLLPLGLRARGFLTQTDYCAIHFELAATWVSRMGDYLRKPITVRFTLS